MMEDIRLGFWEAVPWRWTAVDVRHCNFQTAAKVADPPLYRHLPGNSRGQKLLAAVLVGRCRHAQGWHVTALWRLRHLLGPAGDGCLLHCSKAGCRVCAFVAYKRCW